MSNNEFSLIIIALLVYYAEDLQVDCVFALCNQIAKGCLMLL